jgi:hypothetical protein
VGSARRKGGSGNRGRPVWCEGSGLNGASRRPTAKNLAFFAPHNRCRRGRCRHCRWKTPQQRERTVQAVRWIQNAEGEVYLYSRTRIDIWFLAGVLSTSGEAEAGAKAHRFRSARLSNNEGQREAPELTVVLHPALQGHVLLPRPCSDTLRASPAHTTCCRD